MSTKIVFLGSKPIGYQCLEYLIQQAPALNAEVIAVRTQERKEFAAGNDLSALATAHNIPQLASLDDLPECDIICSVQHHELLKAAHISKAGKIAVNLHLAPLPEYRGCNQFSFAILDGVTAFGVTLHEMDTRIDHGHILFEKRFPVREDSWVNDLYRVTEQKGIELFKESLGSLLTGNYTKQPQEDLVSKRGTQLHFRSEIRQLKEIDLSQPKEKTERIIRALSMPGFEPPYCMINGEKVYFSKQ